MKKLIYIALCMGLMLNFTACEDENTIGPLENDGIAPGPISNPTVENKHGAATITYELPDADDLMYVKASYITDRGIHREAKASYYTNKIDVTGFGSTNPYEVLLYVVDKGENVSEPVSVTVNPLKPPFLIVSETIEVIEDFGGIKVSFKNEGEDNIAIVVLANDSLGNFVPFNTNYTKLPGGDFSVRGLEPVETQFGIYIRDRWGNISDTTLLNLTPLYEILLDKSKIKGVALPNDAPLGYGGHIGGLFNDTYDRSGGDYHTGDAARMPQWFTFDLGEKAKLSRLTWWMRADGTRWIYNLHNPRFVEIWGSNDPAPDGSWESWELMAEHEQIKPSGLPVGQLTNDDIDAAEAGETVTFSPETPAYRFIRFKTLRNWSDGTYVNFVEMTLWGQPIE